MDKVKVRFNQDHVAKMELLMDQLHLNTVCKEANCPNLGECYQKKTATFMILGRRCTRNCRFCNVTGGKPEQVSQSEPDAVARAVKELGLSHVVVTSVTRDDLKDGGAAQFAHTIRAIRSAVPGVAVEVLIPDLKGDEESLNLIIGERPEVINHNLETVPALYPQIRPEAEYHRSLAVLAYIKQKEPKILTKTGIMAGLGEKPKQVCELMDDARAVGCDIFTIGQYMRPSEKHIAVHEMISQEMFDAYKQEGLARGFTYVASGPLVRSSYCAKEAIC